MYFYLTMFIIFFSFSTDIRKYGLVKSIFLPKNILYLFISIFYVLPIYFGIEILSNLTKDINLDDLFNYISILILSLIIFIHFVSKSSINKKEKVPIINKYYNFSLKFIIIFYLFFLIIISYETLIPLISGLSTSEISMNMRNGGALKFFIIASCEFLPLIFLIYSKKVNYYLLIILIFFSCLLIISMGARSLIFSMFLSIILYFITLGKFKKRNLLIIILTSSFFFLGTSLNRSSDSDIVKYLVRNLDQVVSTAVVIDKLNKKQIDYQYGGTIIDALYFFIPSGLMQSKPKSYAPSRIVYPEMISRGISDNTRHTMNFGLIGRGYLEFGLIGVFFFTLIYLKLFNFYYKKIINDDFKSKKNKLYIIFAYSHIHQFIILGATSHIYSIILFNFFLLMIIDLSIVFVHQVKKL